MKLPWRYRDALVDQVHPTGDFQPYLIKFPNLFSAARVTVKFHASHRRNFSPPLPYTIVQSCKDWQTCSNALNGFIPPAKPNFDRRPRTAKTIYPELPPDQASISIHSCQHWPHSRCKNINTLPLPPFEIRIPYLPTFSRLSIDNYIHPHCAESIWSLHTKSFLLYRYKVSPSSRPSTNHS